MSHLSFPVSLSFSISVHLSTTRPLCFVKMCSNLTCVTVWDWDLISDRRHRLGNISNSLAYFLSRQHGSSMLGICSPCFSHLTPPYASGITHILTHCSDTVNRGPRKPPTSCVCLLRGALTIFRGAACIIAHESAGLVKIFFLFIPILLLPYIFLKSHCLYFDIS